MYSLLGCCKVADVKFRDWIVYALSKIYDYDTDYSKSMAELSPNSRKAQQQKFLENIFNVSENTLNKSENLQKIGM